MERFCLFVYTGLTDRFRRARGFLYNLDSLLYAHPIRKNVSILEIFLYDKEQNQFYEQKCEKCS